MGTVYHITAQCPSGALESAGIDARLEWVNRIMSTYERDSTLSRFNRHKSAAWFAVEPELAEVMQAALYLSEVSAGAFDVTVGPLINLWGFGPGEGKGKMQRSGELPSQRAIEKALSLVGYERLSVSEKLAQVKKTLPDHGSIYVDLSAIAKGFGVDDLAEYLSSKQCTNYLVDIGGEVRTLGQNPRSRVWRVGVEVPDVKSFDAINRIVELSGVAVATSGDYRNFIEWNGKSYSHIIDPRTGRPVNHSLASVTVIHSSTMMADGFATLLTVLGPEAGLEFAREHALAALFVWRVEEGFEQENTELFEQYLVD